MSDPGARRRALLVVPSAQGGSVLGSGFSLPVIDLTLLPGETTIEAVARTLPTIGLRGPVLDCIVDQIDHAELGDDARSTLIELAPPPADWSPPDGWSWQAWDSIDPDPPAGLADAAHGRLAELRGDRPVPDERAAWTRPGWYEAACTWIEASLASAGRTAPEAVVQVRHWGISAVMRAELADERCWFKASFPPFGHEPAVSALLSEIAPGATCGVIAADPVNAWLLLDDLGVETGAGDPDAAGPAIDHLVRLQSTTLTHRDALLDSGCSLRPLMGLGRELEVALASEVAGARLDVTPDRIKTLVDAVERAVVAIDAVGFPETLVHGDFHPGNVAATDRGVVLFDWSDAAISNPVVEPATWASWFEGDEEREVALWNVFCQAWEREFGIDARQLRRSDVDVVAGAFHTVSYARILSALEPSARVEHADGLDHFFGVLTRGVATHHQR